MEQTISSIFRQEKKNSIIEEYPYEPDDCECRGKLMAESKYEPEHVICDNRNTCLNVQAQIECINCHPTLCVNKNFNRKSNIDLKVDNTLNMGQGLFTNQFFPVNSFIIEYVGEVITPSELDTRSHLVKNP